MDIAGKISGTKLNEVRLHLLQDGDMGEMKVGKTGFLESNTSQLVVRLQLHCRPLELYTETSSRVKT